MKGRSTMCVAIYVPQGVARPDLETVKRCWDSNPDGAGVCFRKKSKHHCLHIEKGFMVWEDFERFYKAQVINTKCDLMMHFRIATHGGVCQGNTHPFPVTGSKEWLKATSVLCNTALMHNGVLDCTPADKTISDSMELCKLIADNKLTTDIGRVFKLLEPFIGTSKLCAFTKDKVYLAGTWYEHDGVKFSNEYWMPGKSRYSTGIGYTANYGYTSTYGYGKSSGQVQSGYEDDYYNGFEVGLEPYEEELALGKCPFCQHEVDAYGYKGSERYYCYNCDIDFVKTKNEVKGIAAKLSDK
jgi:hypothetical protein